MSKPIIEVNNLTKYYGKHRGVIDLSFSVAAGEVFGYLGPNGAGKSTTIRILLDLIRPTDGNARVFGKDSHLEGKEIRKNVGYLPGELSLFDGMTGRETLKYLASVRGGVYWDFVDQLEDRLQVDLDQGVSELSSGNKRKGFLWWIVGVSLLDIWYNLMFTSFEGDLSGFNQMIGKRIGQRAARRGPGSGNAGGVDGSGITPPAWPSSVYRVCGFVC